MGSLSAKCEPRLLFIIIDLFTPILRRVLSNSRACTISIARDKKVENYLRFIEQRYKIIRGKGYTVGFMKRAL